MTAQIIHADFRQSTPDDWPLARECRARDWHRLGFDGRRPAVLTQPAQTGHAGNGKARKSSERAPSFQTERMSKIQIAEGVAYAITFFLASLWMIWAAFGAM